MKLELHNLYNEQAELAVIGSCLMDAKAITRILDKLEPSDFYIKRCGIVYEQIVNNFAKNIAIDLVTISNNLKEDEISATWLTECVNNCVSSANVEHYANIVKEFSKRRQMRLLLVKKNKGINEIEPNHSIDELALEIQSEILEITSRDTIRNIDFQKVVNILDTRMYSRLNRDDTSIDGYWRFNYTSKRLTDITGGIEPQSLIILGALKKSGKTKFIIDQMVHLTVNQKVPILFLSLEMGEEGVTRLIWSRLAKVNSKYIKMPIDSYGKQLLEEDDLRQLRQTKPTIEEIGSKMIVDTRSFLDFNQIKAKILQSIQMMDIKVVFLDYLQRCRIDTRHNQTDAKAIELFTAGLADIARDYKIAIVVLSQLRKVAEGKYATVADIKESGGIPENATHILLFNNVDRITHTKGAEKPFTNNTVIDVVQRDGDSGRIVLNHDLRIGRFWDTDEGLFGDETKI